MTLYGIIDEGINYTSNVQTSPGHGHNLYSLSSGILSGSRWGRRGVEDLGGGLKALLLLENGFSVKRVADIMGEISAASSERSSGTEQVVSR